mmetsp:Transcript_617/g.2081  ORF Transcript_617/g.2081 Transcript_617/m.2081 type:complete len:262 (-) Transcript_617:196-981(-)
MRAGPPLRREFPRHVLVDRRRDPGWKRRGLRRALRHLPHFRPRSAFRLELLGVRRNRRLATRVQPVTALRGFLGRDAAAVLALPVGKPGRRRLPAFGGVRGTFSAASLCRPRRFDDRRLPGLRVRGAACARRPERRRHAGRLGLHLHPRRGCRRGGQLGRSLESECEPRLRAVRPVQLQRDAEQLHRPQGSVDQCWPSRRRWLRRHGRCGGAVQPEPRRRLPVQLPDGGQVPPRGDARRLERLRLGGRRARADRAGGVPLE